MSSRRRTAAVIPVVQGAIIYVHADEFIGELGIEVARKLHRISERFLAMINGVLDTLAQRLGNTSHGFMAERSSNGVSAERKRESGNFLPPPAEIDNAVESRFVIG
jgi:hypothetical protein